MTTLLIRFNDSTNHRATIQRLRRPFNPSPFNSSTDLKWTKADICGRKQGIGCPLLRVVTVQRITIQRLPASTLQPIQNETFETETRPDSSILRTNPQTSLRLVSFYKWLPGSTYPLQSIQTGHFRTFPDEKGGGGCPLLSTQRIILTHITFLTFLTFL